MLRELDIHAGQLAALGHSVRLAIVRHVVQAGVEGAAAGDLQAKLGIPASTLGHHVDRLAQGSLVVARRDGTFIYDSASFATLRALTDDLWEDCCKGGASASCC